MTDGHPGRHYPPDDFGPTLTAARRRAGLGLRQAAQRIGISPGYLSLLEHGHRSPSESVADMLVFCLDIPQYDEHTVRAAAIPGVGRDYRGPATR